MIPGEVLARQRAAFAAAGTPPERQRRRDLLALERMLVRNSDAFADAICADFGNRPRQETRLLEVFPALGTIRHARRNLGRWMAPQRRPVMRWSVPARARVVWQPVGVVGIVVPWNYPLSLAIGPLTAALAAGNRAMLKLSEHTPRFGAVLAAALHGAFSTDRVAVFNGDVELGKTFAALPFDHLLFTGSTAVGHSVMRAAAGNLTPVTLELGGKSPVILGPDADIDAAASAIMSGKYRNAGQTCIAPDYLVLPPDRREAFVAAARRIVMQRFPALLGNADYTTIVSDAQFDRLTTLLDDARAQGATIVPLHDGLREPDRTSRTIPPLAVLDVHDGMRIMQTEIFGPILPILAMDDLDAAIGYVNAHPRPLALYYFGYDARAIERVVERTISGGVAINDTLVQYVQDDLPFGGIGASGMGHYHGRAGFATFSKEKPVFEQSRRNASALLEPPYTRRFDAILNVLMR